MTTRRRSGSTGRQAADRAMVDALRARLAEAEETLRAIRAGEVDAVIVEGAAGEQIYTLRSAEQPYRTLVEQMREGAALLTLDGTILYGNRRLAELVGAPLEDVIGAPLAGFVSDDDRSAVEALLARGAGARRARLLQPEGAPLLDAYVSVTTTTADAAERRSVIVADLSELADAEAGRERAERESRAKDEFIAMLAHELRNPLGAIAGAMQLLDAAGHQEAIATRARLVISRQVGHLSRLIDDLLDAGRLVTGKVRVEREPHNLADVVRRGVGLFTESGRLDRHVELSVEPVWIDADVARIEQIVGNVFGNAVKYTGPGGCIRVTLASEGDEAVLRVDDDGAGMEPELVPRIFELFVQGDRAPDRAAGGLGIGLTLVRHLVELHGGSISAASAGPSRGSTFTLRFPRVAERTDVRHETVPALTAARRRIAVIEDNRDAREMYRLALALAGHDVLEAEDGPAGLDLLKTERPDLALIDIGLPRLDGYEVARRYRRESGSDRTLLVALTGYGAAADRQQARDAGFDHHLVKPVSPDAIGSLLEMCPRGTAS